MNRVRSLLERRGGMEMAPQCIEKIESAPGNGLPAKAAVRGRKTHDSLGIAARPNPPLNLQRNGNGAAMH